MAIRSLPRLAASTSLPGRDLADGPEAPTPETPAPAPEARRETARGRLAAMTRSEALHAAGASWAGADRAAGTEAGASAPTVARWRRQVAGLPRGERIAALLDQPGRGRRAMFTTTHEMAETVEAMVLKGGPHCTAAHARRVLLARFGIAPSVRELYTKVPKNEIRPKAYPLGSGDGISCFPSPG